MPLPLHGSDFHLTHRFSLDLTSVDFGDAAANLFGLDNGANIGLEYRFGVIKHSRRWSSHQPQQDVSVHWQI